MVGEMAALGSALAWALVSVLLRDLQIHLNAVSLNAFRCIFAALMATAAVVATGRTEALTQFSPHALTYLVVSVFFGVGIGDLCYFYGLKYLGVIRGLLLSNFYPIFTAVIAAAFLDEPVTPIQFVGTLLVILGVILVMLPGRVLRSATRPAGSENERLGLVMVLLASLCWAASTILLKIGLPGVDSVAATAVRLIAASPVLLVVAAVVPPGLQVRAYHRRQVAGVILSGLFTAASSLLFLVAIQFTGAAKSATLISTSPLFGAPISALMGEKLTWQIVAGSLVSIAGIWLVATA